MITKEAKKLTKFKEKMLEKITLERNKFIQKNRLCFERGKINDYQNNCNYIKSLSFALEILE